MTHLGNKSGPGRYVRSSLFGAGLAVILAMVWTAREDLITLLSTLHLGLMGLAILAGVILLFAQGVVFSVLMTKHGASANDRVLVAVFLVSQPGKYIPGKVWPVFLQAAALGRGHGLARVALANLELMAINILHMTGLGLACLLVPEPVLATVVVVATTLLGGAIVLMPTDRIAAHLPKPLQRRFGLEVIAETQRHGRAKGRAMFLSAVLVGTNLLASLCVLYAIGEALPRDLYAPVLAILYLGFAASILALPVPAGLGVREAASVGLGILLVPEMPFQLILSVALLARFWQLLTDSAVFAIGAAALQFSRQG